MDQNWIETLRSIHLGLFRLLSGSRPITSARRSRLKKAVSVQGVKLIKIPSESQSTAQTSGLLSGLKTIVQHNGYVLNATLNTSGRLGFYFLNEETASRFFDLFDKVHADPQKGAFKLRINGIYDSIGMFRTGRLNEIIRRHQIGLPELHAQIAAGKPALMIGIHHVGILTEVQLEYINRIPVLHRAMMVDPCQQIFVGSPLDSRPCNLAERSLFMAVCLSVEPVVPAV